MISEQRERWLAAGAPSVPTLVVDGVAHVLQHPSQAGGLLGLVPPVDLRDAPQVAWDLDEIVGAWLELAEMAPWPALTAPGVVLGRTPLALTVDALVGVAAVTGALWTGWFHWPGDPRTGETGDAAIGPYEASVVAEIGARDDLLAFAHRVARGWRAALAEHDDVLQHEPASPISAPRGELTLVELLEAQRLHAAGHYRQATASLEAARAPVPSFDPTTLPGLVLPQEIG